MFKPGDLAWHKKAKTIVEIIGPARHLQKFLSVEGQPSYLDDARNGGKALHVLSHGSPFVWFGLLYMEWPSKAENLIPLNYDESKDKADILVSPVKDKHV